MGIKIAFWLLWAGFIAYVLLLAPPLHLQETLTLIKNFLTGHWSDINPIILSLFSLIGVWLQIYSCILFIDAKTKDPFLAFCLGISRNGSNWSVALFSSARSKSRVFWAKGCLPKPARFSFDGYCTRAFHNRLAGIRFIGWRLGRFCRAVPK